MFSAVSRCLRVTQFNFDIERTGWTRNFSMHCTKLKIDLGSSFSWAGTTSKYCGKSPALDLYRLFRDPHSAFDIATRSYSFMTIGPVSPLSFSGTPLFLNAYNTVEEFMRINQLKSAD
jgi:hypothetical protein